MTCRLCSETSTHFAPSDRRCSFGPDGRFRSGGSHCATMGVLLGLATLHVAAHGAARKPGDLSVATIGAGERGVIVLAWHGSMARVGYAGVVAELGEAIAVAQLDLATVDALIAEKAGRTS